AQPGRTGRTRRDLELHSDHRTDRYFRDPGGGRRDRPADDQRRLDGGVGLFRNCFPRRSFRHADHHRPASCTECARSIPRARVLDVAVGTDGWLPVVTALDRRAHPQGASVAGQFAAVAARMMDGTSITARRFSFVEGLSVWELSNVSDEW